LKSYKRKKSIFQFYCHLHAHQATVNIGVARGALGACDPQGGEKILWPNIQGKVLSASRRQSKSQNFMRKFGDLDGECG